MALARLSAALLLEEKPVA